MSEKDTEAVFAVLRTALWGEERYPLVTETDVDWAAVCEELLRQTVGTVTVDVLGADERLSAALRREWVARATRGITFWHHLMQEQARLETIFRNAGIPYVVLKGAAAACYYPKPEYRTMGDVDMIVPPEVFERAFQTMVDEGYCHTDHGNERHANFSRNGVEFELHRYFALMDDSDAAGTMDDRIFKGIRCAEERCLEKYSFLMLPELENGLVLLAHIDQHMRVGLGLRQVIDWMMFVDRKLDDGWWQREFGDWARILKLDQEAIVLTRMCQMYLGLREEEITWCAGADETLCYDLVCRILKSGNFGCNWRNARHGVMALRGVSRLKDIPMHLQKRGCANWKTLQRYPFLTPFAWAYQLCRYAKLGLQREQPIRQLISDIKEKKKQEKLFNYLKIANRK